MTYTLQQKDGRDSYYMYVEDSRGEAEGCLGRNTIWHGLNMVTSTLTMRSLQTFSAEENISLLWGKTDTSAGGEPSRIPGRGSIAGQAGSHPFSLSHGSLFHSALLTWPCMRR